MIDLTAIILTKNEEINIVDCINSIKDFAKRIVVVDSGSTDRTCEIAKEMGADVLFNKFEYYAKQFNWGIENAGIDTEWILRLDADERFTPKLCEEVEKIVSTCNSDVNGITMEADFYFMKRLMKHGGSNKRKIMIFRRNHGCIEDRKRDAHTIIFDGVAVATKNRFQHYDFKDIDSFIKKYNWYATREMQDYIAYKRGASTEINSDKNIQKTRKKKFGFYYKLPKFFRCWLFYLYKYYFKLGFLDGKEGKMYYYYECYWYRFLVDSKIYEFEKTGNQEFEDLKALD